MSILPAVDSVEAGGVSQGFTVTMLDKNGHVIQGRTPSWKSGNESFATVDASGHAHGVAVGQTTVTAFADGKQAQATLKVIIELAQIIATPDSMDVPISAARPITLQLIGPHGEAITGRTVTWASANTAVATVGATGFVTGISLGTTSITATVGSKVATVRVRVTAEPVAQVKIFPQVPVAVVRLGLTFQLSATCYNQNSQILPGRTVLWTSSSPTVASVNANGVVTGVALGSALIQADCDGAKAFITAQVTPIPVSSVTITPPSLTIQVGQQQQLAATAKDSAGNVLSLVTPPRQVLWTSDNLPVATVGQTTGVVAGVSAGTANVQVTVEGISSAPIAVTVQNVPVATVVITGPNTVKVGTTIQLSAQPKDANGGNLNGRLVTWSSSDESIASVSPTSGALTVVTGKIVGPVTITATCEGVSGTIQITVTP